MNIKVSNLVKSYGRKTIFEDISFEIHDGEMTILTGPSGCGKTTLMRILCGLEKQDTGEIRMVNESSIAWIPQDLGLWPNMSAYQNVAMACSKTSDGTSKRDHITSILKKCELEEYRKKSPAKLSAGEQQRVALARALVSQPKILLLDEPFASLDLVRRSHFFKLLKDICHEDMVVMIITHDPFDVIGLGAKRVLVMEDGKIKEDVDFTPNREEKYLSETLQTWKQLSNSS